jgi:hypothetical protein
MFKNGQSIPYHAGWVSEINGKIFNIWKQRMMASFK